MRCPVHGAKSSLRSRVISVDMGEQSTAGDADTDKVCRRKEGYDMVKEFDWERCEAVIWSILTRQLLMAVHQYVELLGSSLPL